jgi:hypothetical protein
MIKLVYDPEDGGSMTDELCMVSQGIRAIANAMRAYTLDDVHSPEAQETIVAVWPLLRVLIEPLAAYFFEKLGEDGAKQDDV